MILILSSPRVDSIFSRENWFSPSAVLSLATQLLSSVTVLSRRVHSFTRISTLFTHSSETAFTLAYLSRRAATSVSAVSWEVIFRDSLHLGVSLTESSPLGVGSFMGGHLLRCGIGSLQKLEMVNAGFVECVDLIVEGLGFIQVGGFGKTFTSGSLRGCQPGSEFLDASLVLSPELDIFGVFVAFNGHLLLEIFNILHNSVKLILEVFGILRDSITLGQQFELLGSFSLDDLNLGGDIFLKVHGSGHTVLRGHAGGAVLDVIEFISGLAHPGINGFQGDIKLSQSGNKFFNLLDLIGESFSEGKTLEEELQFFVNDLLFVIGDGDAHAGEVI